MGTRNMTLVVKDGEYKIAQYGQWDGYPEGQGATCLEFIGRMNREDSWQEFARQLDQCRFLTNKEMKDYERRNKAGESINEINGYLTRDHGAEILTHVFNHEFTEGDGEILLEDETAFCADGLMCEFAYVIDLDSQTFEAYTGWNKDPEKVVGRFADMAPVEYDHCAYTQVTKVEEWPLSEPPTVEQLQAVYAKYNADEEMSNETLS